MYLGFSICQIEDIGDTNFFRSWWESPWSEDVVSEGEVRADQPNWSVGLTGATESLQTGLGQSQSRKKLRVITVSECHGGHRFMSPREGSLGA